MHGYKNHASDESQAGGRRRLYTHREIDASHVHVERLLATRSNIFHPCTPRLEYVGSGVLACTLVANVAVARTAKQFVYTHERPGWNMLDLVRKGLYARGRQSAKKRET